MTFKVEEHFDVKDESVPPELMQVMQEAFDEELLKEVRKEWLKVMDMMKARAEEREQREREEMIKMMSKGASGFGNSLPICVPPGVPGPSSMTQ